MMIHFVLLVLYSSIHMDSSFPHPPRQSITVDTSRTMLRSQLDGCDVDRRSPFYVPPLGIMTQLKMERHQHRYISVFMNINVAVVHQQKSNTHFTVVSNTSYRPVAGLGIQMV